MGPIDEKEVRKQKERYHQSKLLFALFFSQGSSTETVCHLYDPQHSFLLCFFSGSYPTDFHQIKIYPSSLFPNAITVF